MLWNFYGSEYIDKNSGYIDKRRANNNKNF